MFAAINIIFFITYNEIKFDSKTNFISVVKKTSVPKYLPVYLLAKKQKMTFLFCPFQFYFK
jgi:hypothetical protein